MQPCTRPTEQLSTPGTALPPWPDCEHPECAAAYDGVDLVELDVAIGAPAPPGPMVAVEAVGPGPHVLESGPC